VIQNADERIELKRTDKKWRLESPVKDLADSSAVENLLFDLEDWKKETTISAKEIEADKSRMAEYGVAKAKLRLKLQGPNAPPEVLFGNNAALEARFMFAWRIRKMCFSLHNRSKTRFRKSRRNSATAN
jgi:hypothetical protein